MAATFIHIYYLDRQEGMEGKQWNFASVDMHLHACAPSLRCTALPIQQLASTDPAEKAKR